MLNPNIIDIIKDTIPPNTEVIPSIPTIQGIIFSEVLLAIFNPRGNIIPIKKLGMANTAMEKIILYIESRKDNFSKIKFIGEVNKIIINTSRRIAFAICRLMSFPLNFLVNKLPNPPKNKTEANTIESEVIGWSKNSMNLLTNVNSNTIKPTPIAEKKPKR